MQQAPVLKGSGLKPLEIESSAHVFGSNLESRVLTEKEPSAPTISFDTREEDDISTIRKRKFEALTGEEDEETVFQGDFKLFVWDLATSNWIEKGRGQLKLNDSIDDDQKKSRIIMRVGGTLKIVLNVAIRHSTFKVIASSKTSIRFTDSQNVWAASGSNASQLRDLIDERLESTDITKRKKLIDGKSESSPDDDKSESSPDDEKSESSPDDEKSESSPDHEKSGSTPDDEKSGSTLDNEKSGSAPDNERSELTPEKEKEKSPEPPQKSSISDDKQ